MFFVSKIAHRSKPYEVTRTRSLSVRSAEKRMGVLDIKFGLYFSLF